ncbi:hypothetical protein F2Q69_00022745 [Brassica cretica]|uniref:Uncharacterized protein n=1 Tax=Brassica cretica TaxID=69181 RepID=A0A8S9Q3M0_BRACR|nr:hypothetical protein F2Q69_00022745 [Brassica cretica]
MEEASIDAATALSIEILKVVSIDVLKMEDMNFGPKSIDAQTTTSSDGSTQISIDAQTTTSSYGSTEMSIDSPLPISIDAILPEARQQKISAILDENLDSVYSDLHDKCETLSDHVKKLDSQVAHNKRKCLSPSTVEITYAEKPPEAEKATINLDEEEEKSEEEEEIDRQEGNNVDRPTTINIDRQNEKKCRSTIDSCQIGSRESV